MTIPTNIPNTNTLINPFHRSPAARAMANDFVNQLAAAQQRVLAAMVDNAAREGLNPGVNLTVVIQGNRVQVTREEPTPRLRRSLFTPPNRPDQNCQTSARLEIGAKRTRVLDRTI